MLSDLVRYPYLDPSLEYVDKPEVLFWKCRAVIDSNSGNRRKTFWYSTPQPGVRGLYAYGNPFNTTDMPKGPATDAAVFRLHALRAGLDRKARLVVWTEGEKDALAARVYGVPSFCSHGGAGKATIEQAHHLAGYKGGVVIVADRDDAGYADAYVRAEHCKTLGLEFWVVRPADPVVNPAWCPPGTRCYCDKPCPVAGKLWKGADLSDHIATGLPIDALVEVPDAELAEAHAKNATAGYNAKPPAGYTAESWRELNAECVAIMRASGAWKDGWK